MKPVDDKLEEAILRALKTAGSPLGAPEVRVCTMLDDPPLETTKAQVAKALKGLVTSGKVTRKGYGRGTAYSLTAPPSKGLVDIEPGADIDIELLDMDTEEIL